MYIQRSAYIREERYRCTLATYLRVAHSIPYCRSLPCGAVQVPVRHVHSLDRIQRNAAAKPRWLQRATCFVADVDACLCAAVHHSSHALALGLPRCRTGRRSTRRWSSSRSRFPKRESSQHCRWSGTDWCCPQSSANAALTHFVAAPVHSPCLPRVTDLSQGKLSTMYGSQATKEGILPN